MILLLSAFASIGIGATLAKYASIETVGNFNLHVEPKEHTFAVYSDDDNSLTFYNGVYPEEGKKYNDKTATNVYYEHIETDTPDNPYWSDIAAKVKTVDFVATVSPVSTKNWFKDFTNVTSFNLTNLNTSNVTTMYGMFWGCESLTALNVSNFNTSKVKSMSYMFARCSKLTSLDVSGFNTLLVTNMSFMFANSPKLTSITLNGSNFGTSKVTTMENMFAGCESLQELDLSHFNTANVKNMTRMFNLNYNLKTLHWSSSFTTANVTSMTYMFNDCNALQNLDLSSFDTSKVTNMECMFRSCYVLETLDLSGFKTSKVTSMKQMFENSKALKTIYVTNSFVTTNVSSSSNMFKDCVNLVGGSGTTYSSSNTGKTYARIDNPPDALGYFSLKSAA